MIGVRGRLADGSARLDVPGYENSSDDSSTRLVVEVCEPQQAAGDVRFAEHSLPTSVRLPAASFSELSSGSAGSTGTELPSVRIASPDGQPLQIERPPVLRLHGWTRSSSQALLFIHGWTSGHMQAHLTFAQFLNLSRLGNEYQPFIFAWPCGRSVLSFPTVAKLASTHTGFHAALAKFVESLRCCSPSPSPSLSPSPSPTPWPLSSPALALALR